MNILRLLISTLIILQLENNLNGIGLTGDFGRRFGVNSQEMQEPLFFQKREIHNKNYCNKKCSNAKQYSRKKQK